MCDEECPTGTNKKFGSVLGDGTNVIKCSTAAKHFKTFKRSQEKDITLNIKDFLLAKQVVYVTEYSTVMRCHQEVNVNAELRTRGLLLLDKPSTVEAIKASPNKTRVSLKGKIIKVRPIENKLIRKTGVEKEMLSARIKDSTGTIPVKLWGQTATRHSELKVGDCVEIKKAERGVFNSEATLNTWEDSTTIELLPDALDISDAESDDEERQTPQRQQPGSTHGQWVSVGNVTTYEACTSSRCFMKKLMDDICPTCGKNYSHEPPTMALIATAGFQLQQSTDIKTARMFTATIKSAYAQFRPGLSLPDDPFEIEEQLYEFLPKPCSFVINANNVVTDINIL